MVVGSRTESGDVSAISSKDRSTVKSIKEVVGNHSESDIYAVLRETNMDPDEATQKLLNQGVVFSSLRFRFYGIRLISCWFLLVEFDGLR